MNGAESCAEAEPVRRMTPDSVNRKLDSKTEDHVRDAAALSRDELDRRLCALDRSWTIERTLEANASALILVGVGLGLTKSRRWLALSAVVAGFLLEHAVHGWCPPLPLFRVLGVRSRKEIEEERMALKALRGDFGEGVLGGDPAVDPRAALVHIRQ